MAEARAARADLEAMGRGELGINQRGSVSRGHLDPHRDPHQERPRIPVDRGASIAPPASSARTALDVTGQAKDELEMRYPGRLGSRDSSPSPAALSPPRSAAA